jgi:hypothetical protein
MKKYHPDFYDSSFEELINKKETLTSLLEKIKGLTINEFDLMKKID